MTRCGFAASARARSTPKACACRAQELVSAGMLNSWIAESASARQLGIAPTGHAARGVGGAPGASPSNLYMEAGARSREELLAAFPEAVLVIELIGQGVNPVTGDYSRGAVGFMVRGGEIAEPVVGDHHRLEPDRDVRDARACVRPRVPPRHRRADDPRAGDDNRRGLGLGGDPRHVRAAGSRAWGSGPSPL